MSEQKTTAPAGWYDDPSMVNTRRYWDGQAWTEQRTEKPETTADNTEARDRKLVGYGLIFGFLFPIIGFVIGIGLLFSRPAYGLRVVLASIVGTVIWAMVLGSQ